MKKFYISLLAAGLFVTQGCINDEPQKGAALGVGDPLPPFSVAMSNGENFSTQSFIGKIGVIVFFNTGCKDCRQELPEIEKLWQEYKDNESVLIIPIAREESEREIKNYWEANDFKMPFSPQENREVYSLFATSIIPRIFISNHQGIIVFSSDDTDMPSYSTLSSITQSILQE